MSKSKNKKTEIDAFAAKVRNLQDMGYVALPRASYHTDDKAEDPKNTPILNSMAQSTNSDSGAMFGGKPDPVTVESVGTQGLGYVEWGAGNCLPNIISRMVSLLPYTAAGVKFNIDTVASVGPKLQYRWTRFVNGELRTDMIDYKDAGVVIRGQLLSLRATLSDFYISRVQGLGMPNNDHSNGNGNGNNSNGNGNGNNNNGSSNNNGSGNSNGSTTTATNTSNGSPIPSYANDSRFRTSLSKNDLLIEAQLLEDVARLEAAYARWEKTSEEVRTFTEDNDLNLTFLKLFVDDGYMDISFPEIMLNKGEKEEWNPRIVGIRHRSVMTCRMEQMDEDERVKNIYVSNQWRTSGTIPSTTSSTAVDNKIIAIPALNPETAIKDLRDIVRKRKTAGWRSRPTNFILPTYYPSIDHPYYPHPSWWSIFPGMVYKYACTLMNDKAIARENSNTWGQIVYVHMDYLNALYASSKATTDDERTAVIDKIWQDIDGFLQDKTNRGKTLMSYKFRTNDGKETYAYEIVAVPSIVSGSDTKAELEEIASILFFALEVHPSLIGAVPGRSGSSGGTYQRELFLLKQLRTGPRRKRYLRILDFIHAFNGWDKDGVWTIPDVVLTTLDRSKTGLEESPNT